MADTETPQEATLQETVDQLSADVASIAKKNSLKPDTVVAILNIWLNYDVTLRQMEMAAAPPMGAAPLSPDQIRERLEEAAARMHEDQPPTENATAETPTQEPNDG